MPWKKLNKTSLYSRERAYLNMTWIDRRIPDGSGFTTTCLSKTQIAIAKVNNAKDLNLVDRVWKFQNQLKNEHVYRILLKYFKDLGKINFPLKIDFSIKCQLQTDMKRLFESKKVLAAGSAVPSPDAKIIFTKATFIQYEQILQDKNFRQYLETIMVSKKILRIGAQKIPIEKTYEINTGTDTINVDFLGANRQFDWLDLSIVYDKSDKHTTIYDIYNLKTKKNMT